MLKIATCESEPERIAKINVDATVSLAKCLLNANCHVLFISSNAVFNGKIKDPNKDEITVPTEYGRLVNPVPDDTALFKPQ